MRRFVSSKIHGVRVTAKSVKYHGSVTIGRNFMDLAGIDEYEKVQVVNLTNGNRWTTYAIPGDPDQFILNGGDARLGEIGDECVVMTYCIAARFPGCAVVFCDGANRVTETTTYAHS